MHHEANPAVLYFGTPVALISTLNEDGSPNLAPMSSVWWLGYNAMLGFGARSKTPQNLLRTGECVINLPSAGMVAAVDALAKTTGSDPAPPHKVAMGYRHEREKFLVAGLTAEASLDVAPPRVHECPVQLEARLAGKHALAAHIESDRDKLVALEVTITRVHLHESIRMAGREHRVDPDLWRPLIMSFCRFYGLGAELQHSTLAEIPEDGYRPLSRRELQPAGPR
jgi:flavin reductase (DIM6/NTAB) family NADH-FMN oxidoreductase RutF